MSSYLKSKQKQEIRQKNKSRLKELQTSLLEMNKVYHELKHRKKVTIEDIKDVSNYKFNDYMIELLLRDLNEDNN